MRYKISMKFRSRLIIIFLILVLIAIFIRYLANNHIMKELGKIPTIVWIANWPEYERITKYCDTEMACDITIRNKLLENMDVKAYLFYGSDFDYKHLPLPRESQKYIWALYHEESPRNRQILMHEKALNLFNFSSTFSRFSDCPLTLQYLNGYNDIISDKHFLETNVKNALLDEISPVLYLQSDCDTMTERDAYVTEMMKYINVDSYGSCLRNKELPHVLSEDYLEKLSSDEFLKFVARYKFTISFENGVCNDYITEKLWRPVSVGSVPIYLGSPTVKDWLPNPKTIIAVEDFKSPKELAEFIDYLNKNDEMYDEYLRHKLHKKILNKQLIEMMQKVKELDDLYNVRGIEAFECFVCRKVYQMVSGELTKSSMVTKSHYDCPKPSPSFIKKDDTGDSWWLMNWYFTRSEAEATYKEVMEENNQHLPKVEN